MKKYAKMALWGLLGLLVVGQAIRPERNLSNDQTAHIRTQHAIPADVESMLEVACYDCHSNHTRYPWYANVQPVASWLANHVEEGKRELNFSTLTKRRIAVQNHKMEEVIEMVREKEMPLSSYTWTHADARLTDAQRERLVQWAQGVMDTLKARYPADSLVLKRRG